MYKSDGRNLPNDLNLEPSAFLKVFDYEISKECFKQMVSLQQNIFSFLIECATDI
jgi:hypothetical protein